MLVPKAPRIRKHAAPRISPNNQAIMTQIDKTTSELYQFLGCYLHQDFGDDYGNVENAIAAYFREVPIARLKKLLVDVDEVLALSIDDKAFDALLFSAGSYYYSYADNLTGRQWLQRLRDNKIVPIVNQQALDYSKPT